MQAIANISASCSEKSCSSKNEDEDPNGSYKQKADNIIPSFTDMRSSLYVSLLLPLLFHNRITHFFIVLPSKCRIERLQTMEDFTVFQSGTSSSATNITPSIKTLHSSLLQLLRIGEQLHNIRIISESSLSSNAESLVEDDSTTEEDTESSTARNPGPRKNSADDYAGADDKTPSSFTVDESFSDICHHLFNKHISTICDLPEV